MDEMSIHLNQHHHNDNRKIHDGLTYTYVETRINTTRFLIDEDDVYTLRQKHDTPTL